jgi:hypothetical protein
MTEVLHPGSEIMRKLRAFPRWIKSNPLIVLAGTSAAFILTISNVTPVILKGLNLPECFTYAGVYGTPWSHFKREGMLWREYFNDESNYRFEFKEFDRTRTEIIIQNATPRVDLPHPELLMISLPVCGGTSKITDGHPPQWTPWVEIRREK